jgi:kynurenine formamidase
VDVTGLTGTTKEAQWPASPVITAELLERDEQKNGKFHAGQIVIFRTSHLDRHFKAAPDDKGVWADPLTGKSEGWAAPDAAAIQLLKRRGIRCVATDAPDLGGVNPKQAAMTYWALGSADMVGIEFLNNVGNLPAKSYFLFAATRIRDAHASPGRAIGMW